jgi:hypothetical protein
MNLADIGAESLSRILQFSITPVVLISAVGLLLLSLSNRFGRAIDRSRDLGRALDGMNEADRAPVREQLRIVVSRAHWLRRSITLVAASLFLSCLMIFLMFLEILAGWTMGAAIMLAFALDILALIAAIGFFLLELQLALKALEIEVAPHLRRRPSAGK